MSIVYVRYVCPSRIIGVHLVLGEISSTKGSNGEKVFLLV